MLNISVLYSIKIFSFLITNKSYLLRFIYPNNCLLIFSKHLHLHSNICLIYACTYAHAYVLILKNKLNTPIYLVILNLSSPNNHFSLS